MWQARGRQRSILETDLLALGTQPPAGVQLSRPTGCNLTVAVGAGAGQPVAGSSPMHLPRRDTRVAEDEGGGRDCRHCHLRGWLCASPVAACSSSTTAQPRPAAATVSRTWVRREVAAGSRTKSTTDYGSRPQCQLTSTHHNGDCCASHSDHNDGPHWQSGAAVQGSIHLQGRPPAWRTLDHSQCLLCPAGKQHQASHPL